MSMPNKLYASLASLFAVCGLFFVEASAAFQRNASQQESASNGDARPPLDARVEQLLLQLGSQEPSLREQAENDLLQLGSAAFDVLETARDHEDPEIAERVRYLIAKIEFDWVATDDPPAVRSLMEQYRRADASRRYTLIDSLYRLESPPAALALARIVRNDMAPELSSYAAAALIDLPWARLLSESPSTAAGVASALAASRQVGADWVRVALAGEQSPATKLELWKNFTQRRMKETPVWIDAYSAIVTASLLHHWETLNSQTGQSDQANIDQMLLTEAFGGDIDRWRGVAQYQLYQTAGHVARAEREFRSILRVDNYETRTSFFTSQTFGEMLHDQGRDDEAGAVFLKCMEAVDASDVIKQGILAAYEQDDSMFDSIRSRGRYCLAMDHLKHGRKKEHLDELLAAIEDDPTDADVLIALHNLPDQDDERRRKTDELIRSAAEVFESEILASPDDESAYNQYAWLIGNTKELEPGDFDKAIRYSQKSISIRNSMGMFNAGGYYDTLAHAFAAKKDYAKAVQAQAKAVELEPYSRQIASKFEYFKRKLAEK